MKVGELCRREVATIDGDESVAAAARRMRDARVDQLIVVERGGGGVRPVGVVTERDLVVSVLADEGADPAKLQIGTLVRDGFASVTVDEDLDETLHRMRSFEARRLPVIDRSGHVHGVVTLDDVLAAIRREVDAGTLAQHRRRASEVLHRGPHGRTRGA
ncbi:MAG: CBS domain-containing protein [Deltaproteobacteria bacterium]|nr:CBS domain-containing protein [Deltaproteobacteria bacterium]